MVGHRYWARDGKPARPSPEGPRRPAVDQHRTADDEAQPGADLRDLLGGLSTRELALLAHQRRHLIDRNSGRDEMS